MSKQGFRCLIAGIVSIVLAGCSAGGGETGTGQDPSSVTVGVITGFGSVFINGIEYETDQSDITLDGQTLSETNLKVGMVVTLAGDVNADGVTGNAISISYNDNVEGMVLSNTVTTNNQLVILGQTIIIDDFDTVFESKVATISSFAQIQTNNIVEVSGHTSGDGVIYATRVEVKAAARTNSELELEGLVTSVTQSTNPMTFKIGNMTVVYTEDVLKDFNGLALKDGDLVEVKSVSDLNADGQLVASKVELKELHKNVKELSSDKEFAFEGVITQVVDSTKFLLNGQVIIYDNSTEINDVNSILVGKKAKIEGLVNGSNEVIAKQIEIKTENKVKIEGLITAINPDTKTITVFGDEISVTHSTTLRDERDDIEDDLRHFFNFSNLKVGDSVEVIYFQDADSNFIATKLELDDVEVEDNSDSGEDGSGEEEQKSEWEIKNIIDSYDASTNSIVMQHRTIDISNISDFSVNFVGELVEVQGIIVDDKWIATELNLRTEDQPSGKEDDDGT